MQLGSRDLMMYYIDLKQTNDVLLTFEALKVNYFHNAYGLKWTINVVKGLNVYLLLAAKANAHLL